MTMPSLACALAAEACHDLAAVADVTEPLRLLSNIQPIVISTAPALSALEQHVKLKRALVFFIAKPRAIANISYIRVARITVHGG